jgi:hypothetical protein
MKETKKNFKDMEKELEKEGLEHLEHIEGELKEIKKRTPNSYRAFINGILQGAGAIVGGILAVALLGILLSLFGVIPGFGEIAHYIQNIMSQLHSRP